QYSLDGVTWQAGNTFVGLAAGTYTVYYKESNGCQGSQSVTILQPSILTATSSTVPVVCNGQSNGLVIVNASGATAPYQYSMDGGAYQNSDTFYVAAGAHIVNTRDNNGCISSQPVNMTQPLLLTANTVTQNATCDGGNDGLITVTANGGNSAYQYSIDGINFQPSNVFNTGPGNFIITVKDNLGCTTTKNATVGLTNNLTLTPQADKTICESLSAQLQLTSNATQYLWTPATGLSSTTIPNPVANPVTTTQYIVTATLGRCNANDTVIVNVNAAPIPDAGPDGFICYGQNYQLQGSGGVVYSWTPSSFLSSVAISNPIVTPQNTITYLLSVVDANGCQSLVTDSVKVDVTPPIHVSTFPKDTIIYSGDQLQLLALSGGNIYSWSPSAGLDNPNIPNPVVTGGAVGDVMIYTVTASTIAGCKGDGVIRVKVYKGPDIYMSTGFTPNHDGKNDKFIPIPVGIKQLNYFKVFNRWGQLIFSTTKLNEGWDGTYAGRDQASGVYVWMVQGITEDDKVITKKGTVALIR
ncbi:MAG: gliding motility-associated C-terminal domain-containing protein, partial [Chitinophagales bacterium]